MGILRDKELECFMLDNFEKLFLFEFFVRNLRVNQKEEFERLLQLKLDVQDKINGLHISHGEYCDMEELVCLALNSIQFNYNNSEIKEELRALDIPDMYITDLSDMINGFQSTIKIKLVNKFYKLSDLVYGNDIFQVIDWWSINIDEKIRDEMKLQGEISTKGKLQFYPKDCFLSNKGKTLTKDEKTDCFYAFLNDINQLESEQIDSKQCIYNENRLCNYKEDSNTSYYMEMHYFPFKCPDVIKYKRNNYKIFNTMYDDININNNTLVNSLVLTVSLDKAADNIKNILECFADKFCSSQNIFNAEQVETRGIIPDYETQKSRAFENIIIDKIKSNKVVTRFDTLYQNSISKNLIGLYCYDVFLEKKMTLDESINHVIENLKDQNYLKDVNDKFQVCNRNYNDVRVHIKKILTTLESLERIITV